MPKINLPVFRCPKCKSGSHIRSIGLNGLGCARCKHEWDVRSGEASRNMVTVAVDVGVSASVCADHSGLNAALSLQPNGSSGNAFRDANK